jgi:hypothetical protein
MDPQDEIRKHLRPATLVGAAIVASLLVYLGVVEAARIFLKPFHGLAAIGRIQPFRLAVFGAAAGVILLILLVRPRLFRVNPGQDAAAGLRRLQRAALLVLVLGEVPAILGLGLFLVGGNAADFYKLLFASLVLTFINFPRRAAWEEWLKA